MTINTNTSRARRSSKNRIAIGAVRPIHCSEAVREERAKFKRKIDELQRTLARERLEHNTYLKDMATILRKMDVDLEMTQLSSEQARCLKLYSSTLILINIIISLQHISEQMNPRDSILNGLNEGHVPMPMPIHTHNNGNAERRLRLMYESAVCFLKIAAAFGSCV